MSEIVRAVRYNVRKMSIIYDTGDSFWTAPVVNVSESGLFIETHHELPAGTCIVILPDVVDEDRLPYEIRAEVARVDPYDDGEIHRRPGLAFRFIDMTREEIDKVRAFLHAHGVPLYRG